MGGRRLAENTPEEPTGADHLLGVDGLVRVSEVNLWRRHLQMGVGSFVLGGLLLLGYIALTPHGPNRGAMVVVDIGAMAVSLFVVVPLGLRSLTESWRESFFFCWSVGTLAVITIAIWFDHGVGSPLAPLLVLPVLFGGLLYRLREVVGLAVLALAIFGLMFVEGPSASGARALVIAILIGVAGNISAMGAMNRQLGEEERRLLTDRLHRLATYDGLTGCLNYQSFQDAVAHEVKRGARHGDSFSIVMADVDWFKTVNDRLGHAAGDRTLASVADALREGVRESDLVGRVGGDEFAVLLPETQTDEARHVVGRIQLAVADVATPGQLTLSFGLSAWAGPGDSAAELLRRSDTALYRAKQLGRNRLVIASAPSRTPLAGVTVEQADVPPGEVRTQE